MKTHLNSNPFLRSILLGLAATAVISFSLPSARAAALTWDTVAEDGATITAGSGTWDTTAGNTIWNNAGVNAPWTQTSATVGLNNAVFAGTDGAYTITLAANLASATGLTFSNSGYTLTAAAAQTLIVNGLGTVASVAAGKTATIGSNVTVSFNNGGAANNTGTRFSVGTGATLNIGFTGVLTRTAGLTSDGGTNGSIGFLGTGTVNVAGTLSYAGSGTIGGGVLLATTAGDNITLNVNSGGLVSSSTTANGLLLANNGTATATVNLNTDGTIFTQAVKEGPNAGTSNFNFDGGILRAAAANPTFMTGLDAAVVKAGGAKIDTNAFAVTVGQALTHDSALGGTLDGGLVKSGAGTLTLTGVNTYTGPTSVNGGTLFISNGGSLTSNVTANSGATFGGGGLVSGSLTLTAGSSLAADPARFPLTVSGGVNITGPTSVVFEGIPLRDQTYDILNYSGSTLTGFANLTPAAGRLALTNNTVRSVVEGTFSVGTRTWNTTNGTWEAGGATLNWAEGDQKFFTGDEVIFNNPATPSIVTLNGALSPGSVSVNNTTNAYTFAGSGSITGVTNLVKEGTGTLILTTSNTYTGATNINGGTLQLGDGTTDGSIASTSGVANSGVLAYNWVTNRTAAYPISGTGSLTKAGAGALTLTGASTYTGGTTLSAGALTIGASSTPTTEAVTSGPLGTGSLTLSGGTLNNSGPFTFANNIVINGTTAIQLGGGNNFRLNGNFSGSGSVTLGNQNSNNSLFIGSASNTMTSGTITFANNINSVRIENAGFGNSNVAFVFNNTTVNRSTLDFAVGTIDFGSMTGAGRIQGNAAGAKTISAGALGTTDTFSGVIADGSGTLALTKVGTGTMTLSGTNTYTGPTTISGGELAVSGTSLADAGTLVINAGRLNLTGTETVDKLFFGAVQQPAGNYTAAGDSTHFSGAGTLVVTSGPNVGYSGWADSNAPGQTPEQDHDNDGVKNGIEYFMGLNGTAFTPNPTLSAGTVTWTKGASYTGTYGTSFFIQTSTNLVDWTIVPVGDGVLGNVVNNAGSVSYTPPSGQAKRFGRLVVNN